jgi:Asp/Glu/hydantoin racemase
MSQILVFVHTVRSVVGLFTDLANELLPGVDVVHVSDDLLLRAVLDAGGLTPFAHKRVAQHVIAAEECGASVVQLTCSSVSPCVDVARVMVSIPVLKVDEPMVEQALSLGTRIGVVATAPTALRPTTDLLRARARDQEKRVQVEPILCEGAYAALLCGDLDTHDRIVRGVVKSLIPRCDVVVLAQASMAHVAGLVPAEEQGVPILSSPRLAIERVRGILATLNA